MTDIGIVDFQTQPRRQQHTERRNDTQQPRLAIERFEENDGQSDIRPVFRLYALHQSALFHAGTGRLTATQLPFPMDCTHLAGADGSTRVLCKYRHMGSGQYQYGEKAAADG